MNHHIQYLTGVKLPPPLCYQLRPFISSYRDHDQPPTKKDLDQDDYIPQESVVGQDNILDTNQAIKYDKDVTWLGYKRKYLAKWSGYRTWYNL